MTEPVQPSPGAPAEPAAPIAAPAPALPAEDLASLPDWAQKQIREARAEAGKARTEAKANAAAEARQALAADVAKALGIVGDEPPDPAELTRQISLAQDQAWTAAVELQVWRLAQEHGGDPGSMLDSMAFIASLDDLADVDPRSKEFREQLASKVQAASAKYPARSGTGQASTPRPDPSQGAKSPTRVRASSLTEAVANQRKQLAG
jgi:hypothetical protein